MQNLEPYDKPFWEKSNGGGEKERREKNAVSGHLVPWQRTQAARAKILLFFTFTSRYLKHLIMIKNNQGKNNANRTSPITFYLRLSLI